MLQAILAIGVVASCATSGRSFSTTAYQKMRDTHRDNASL